MSLKISTLMTDTTLENEGKWIDYESGSKLLIGRVGNDKYETRLVELRAPFGDGALKPEDNRRITKQCMAETVLLGWSGLVDDDGKEIPYSPQKAFEFLQIRDFYRTVIIEATNRQNFRQQAKATAVGESQGS